jgi:hypothetical protein
MDVDPEFDVLGFDGAFPLSRDLFWGRCFASSVFVGIHWGSGVGVFPAPDHPMLSFCASFSLVFLVVGKGLQLQLRRVSGINHTDIAGQSHP